MNTWKLILVAGLATALLMATTAAAESLSDVWYEASLGGAPMGHAHETVVTSDSGEVTTTLVSDLVMKRGEDTVSIKGTDEWVESSDGVPMRYWQTRQLAVETQELAVTVNPGNLRIRKSDGRDALFSTLAYEGELLFPRAIERLHVAKGLASGAEYSYVTFDPDFEALATCLVRVEGVEELEVLGETRSLTKLVLTCDLYEGLEFFEWRSSDGQLWREEVPGLSSVRERTTEDIALREQEASDVLAASMIKTNVAFPSPRGVDSALYELWVEDGDIADMLPEDLRQRIEGTTERGVLLRVERVVIAVEEAATFPIRSTPMKDYLDGNALMQTWYPRILGTAAKSVWGAEQNTWKGATQIERWVFDFVEDKGLGTAFASAREVLERMTGDCSEHAILMATMVRAVGIPSKLVAGVVHHEGKFAYHMWVEAWTGEDWHALDPTVGEGSVDATHIKLAESAAPGGRIAELSLGIMRVFSKLGVRVIEYTVDGETTVVSE